MPKRMKIKDECGTIVDANGINTELTTLVIWGFVSHQKSNESSGDAHSRVNFLEEDLG